MPLDNQKLGTPTANPAREQDMAPGLFNAVKAAGSQWLAHKSARTGASLACCSIFSTGPLIVVVISIAALFFQREGVQQQVVDLIKGVIGHKGAEAVGAMPGGAGSASQGVFATIVGTAALLSARHHWRRAAQGRVQHGLSFPRQHVRRKPSLNASCISSCNNGPCLEYSSRLR